MRRSKAMAKPKGRIVLSDQEAGELANELGALQPPSYTAEEILMKYRDVIRARLTAKVRPEEIVKVLKEKGFQVSVASVVAAGQEAAGEVGETVAHAE